MIDRLTDERGVSDVLAFVLALSIILLSATTAYVVGVDELNDAGQYESEQNAVRSMESAGTTLREIYRGDAPRRSIEFAVGGGSLSIDEGSHIEVITDGGTYESEGSLLFSTGDTTASFESGLVASQFEEHSFPRGTAPVVCQSEVGPHDETTAVITLVALDGDFSHSGSSVVVEATASSETLVSDLGADGDVTIDLTQSQRQEAWSETLVQNGWTEVIPDEKYECAATDNVYVRIVTIELTATR